MLKGNLSTRPFYNERIVALVTILIAVVVIALTAFNVRRLVALSSKRSELVGRIQRDETLAGIIQSEAVNLQRTVDQSRLKLLLGETKEANALIDERTFSWTVFFGLIEKTIPMNVRLVAVSPKVEKDAIKVTMIVVARQASDLEKFIEALEAQGAFYDLLPHEQQRNDDGTFSATLQGFYLPPNSTSKPARGKARP